MGETAIYGLSSIVGRFINFLLVALHTRVFAEAEYGVVTKFYAFTGFLIVLFVYRFETAFFRYGTDRVERNRVFDTASLSLLVSTLLFSGTLIIFAQPLSDALRYAGHPEYVRWFALILGFDALCELPFARLRLENRPFRFVAFRLFNILINVGLNVFWLYYCPHAAANGATWVHRIWSPEMGVGYVFLANVVASAATFLLLLPQVGRLRFTFDFGLWKTMMAYSLPLVVTSFAGIANEMLDRVIMDEILPGADAARKAALGIYGANYKLTMLITLFTQAYRYAAEPFFFRNASSDTAMETQAAATKWYTIVATAGMLAVLLYLDVAAWILIDPKYHSGLHIVPILLLANVFLGIYYNVSVWTRLKDKTGTGALIALLGAAITVGCNLWWVPKMGYAGAAWATLACYAVMMVVTWAAGHKHYPVHYPIARMAGYLLLALVLYQLSRLIQPIFVNIFIRMAVHTTIFAFFIIVVWLWERRKPLF